MTAQRIIQQIFQQPELARVSIVTLEGVVDEHPYFTAARLLLAQKNYEQYPNLHSPAVKKAQLYSNNPHYFFQFITGELEKTGDSTPMPASAAAQEPAPIPAPVEKKPFVPNWENITRRESEGDLNFLIREREEIRAALRQIEAQEEEEKAQAAAAAAAAESTLQQEAAAEEEALEEEITYATPEIATEPETTTEPEQEQEPEQEPEDSWQFTVGSEQPVVEESQASAADVQEAMPEAGEEREEAREVQEEKEKAPEEVQEEKEEAPEELKENLAPASELPVNQRSVTAAGEQIKIFPLEIPEEETTLTFQPLYTDDYFAYKRLKEPDSAEQLDEKGAAEMRSFTDWLREMKHSFAKKTDKDWYHQQLHRIYVDDDPEVSETVEKMAMESITLNDDIVSETLAEIWARQRQYQTAIQIYQKLSLLNPNKSAYFAHKIQELQLAQSEADKS
jgi:tetratricopeptide (TPR) repeat protein